MNANNRMAFSLVEVIIAIGVFVFSVTVLLGMLPVGLKSVRSVQNEGNAVHIASSIFGLCQVAPNGASITIPGVCSNLGTVGTAANNITNYFDENGSQVASVTNAAVVMIYDANGPPANWAVSLKFSWPPRGNSKMVQSRIFSQSFTK